MSIKKSKIHPKRKYAIEQLLKMMAYPGAFPILVIGDHGTGKTHWVLENIKKVENEFVGKYKHLDAGLCEETEGFWETKLKEANKHFLVIEDVEKLTTKSQDLLFNALSTTDGKYGIGEKNLEIRIIFTTTFPIKKIRDDRRFLSARFFDRISQFVVEFPNFEQTQTYINEDFNATWDKMFVKTEHKKCPNNKNLKKWLESEADKMHGNFRDLDKIVINWNFHNINGLNEDDILKKIKEDFNKYLQNPSQKIYDDNSFVFDEDSTYGVMLNNFRAKLKKWALGINDNNIRNAASKLSVSHRTMERW